MVVTKVLGGVSGTQASFKMRGGREDKEEQITKIHPCNYFCLPPPEAVRDLTQSQLHRKRVWQLLQDRTCYVLPPFPDTWLNPVLRGCSFTAPRCFPSALPIPSSLSSFFPSEEKWQRKPRRKECTAGESNTETDLLCSQLITEGNFTEWKHLLWNTIKW